MDSKYVFTTYLDDTIFYVNYLVKIEWQTKFHSGLTLIIVN